MASLLDFSFSPKKSSIVRGGDMTNGFDLQGVALALCLAIGCALVPRMIFFIFSMRLPTVSSRLLPAE